MIEKFLELCEDDSFFTSASYKSEIEDLYSNLISSAIGVIKSDVTNDQHLRYIQSIRKDVSKKQKKQSKAIISYCKESSSELKLALEKYKFLNFIKFITRMIDEDDKYKYNVECCKNFFSDKNCLQLTEYLYNHQYVTSEQLRSILGITDGSLPLKYDEILVIKDSNNIPTISLDTKIRNLYAFYLMKNINIDSNDEAESKNYNEGKVNEVLEYLIKYMLSSPKESKKIKKPELHSASAKNNLDKLLLLLNQKDNYSSCPIQTNDTEDKEFFGGKEILNAKRSFK